MQDSYEKTFKVWPQAMSEAWLSFLISLFSKCTFCLAHFLVFIQVAHLFIYFKLLFTVVDFYFVLLVFYDYFFLGGGGGVFYSILFMQTTLYFDLNTP